MNYILTTDTNFSFLFAVVWWRKTQKRQNVKHRLQIPHTSCLDLILRVAFSYFAPWSPWLNVDVQIYWYSRYVAKRGGASGAWWRPKVGCVFASAYGSMKWKVHLALALNFCVPGIMGSRIFEPSNSCVRYLQYRRM